MKFKLLFLLFCLTLPMFLNAVNEDAGTSGFAFMKIKYSARAAGMAEAFTGVADDADAPFYNPAGMFQIDRKETQVTYMNYFDGFNGGSASYIHPLNKKITLAAFSQFMGVSGINKTSYIDNEIVHEGEFGVSELMFGLGTSYYFKQVIKFGANIKYMYEGIDSKTATAFAFDFGIHHQTTNEDLTVGAVIQNLGKQLGYFTEAEEEIKLPVTASVGFNYTGFENLLLALDIYRPLDMDFSGRLGIEWKAHQMFAVRGGYKSNASDWRTGDDLEFLSGASFGASFYKDKYQIDYAISAYGELGLINQISLKYHF